MRCADDFSVSVHPYASAPQQAGQWAMTVDREQRVLHATADDSPYGARFADDGDWLLDRLRHGTFIYLRPDDEPAPGFAYIELAGSFRAIEEALYWCAPRSAPSNETPVPALMPEQHMEKHNEPSAPGTQ